MKVLNFQKLWCLLALINHVCALSLLEVLASYEELSTVYTQINASAALVSLLEGADGFTFFAPTNNAIEAFMKAQRNTSQDAVFQATIQYSLVKGGFPRVSFTDEPQFVPTNLVDAKFSNVTGGQVVELVESNGKPQVISGNRSISTLTTSDIVCAGGLVHIVDQALAPPAQTVNAITLAHLEYFVSILTRGGYLSRAKNQYVHEVLDATDVTYFIPNTRAAVSNFTELAKAWSDEDLKKNFQYHVVPKYVGYSSSLKNGTTLTTVEGTNLTITTHGEDIYVNAAKITTTDYLVSNGVIHVIDNLLDRFDTSIYAVPTPAANRTESAPTSTPAPTTTFATSTSLAPSSTSTTLPAPQSNSQSGSLTLKVGLGAGLGGAAILSLIAFFLFMRRRHSRREPPPIERDSGVWDGHSMSTAPSDPKRYFVNNGSVQMRENVNSMGMVPVTNLESERDAATRYYSERGPAVPPRSPSRLNGGRSYF